MPTNPVAQQQGSSKTSSASEKARPKNPAKPGQLDGANVWVNSDENTDFNNGFELELGSVQSESASLEEDQGTPPYDIIPHSGVQGDTCHMPPFLLALPNATTKQKKSCKFGRRKTPARVSFNFVSSVSGDEEGGNGTARGGSGSGQSDWRIPQLDGPHGESSSEDEEEEESDEVSCLHPWLTEGISYGP